MKLTSLFLKIFKNLTSQKTVPYKAFLIKHNVCSRNLRDGSLAALGPTESYNTSLERSKLNVVRFEPKNDLATSEIL